MTDRDGRTATPAMLQTMGLAYIHAWLTRDFWTMAHITKAMEEAGATWQQVAESFSLAAASLLTDVFDGRSTLAAAAAATKAHSDAARQARASLRAARLPRLHVQPGADVDVGRRRRRFRRSFSLSLSLAAGVHVVVVGGFPFGSVSLGPLEPR